MSIIEFFVIWAALMGVFLLGYLTGQRFRAYRLHNKWTKE